MKANIVSKNKGFGFGPEFILGAGLPVTIKFSVDAGLLLQILVSVRNRSHIFVAKANNGEPLTTGIPGSVVSVTFDLPKLTEVRYVAWSIWATNPMPPNQRTGPINFSVTVVVTQGEVRKENVINARIPKDVQIISVVDDGLAIGTPL